MDTIAGAARLADDWRALAEEQGNAFLTPEWFTTWARHYGRSWSPLVVAVWSAAGGLVGLLPLAHKGRVTRFAGANVGDWFGPLARPGLERAVVRAAVATVASGTRGSLVLHNVDAGAPWIAELVGGWPRRTTTIPLRSDVIPSVPLPSTWAEFLQERSRNFRNQIGRKERNLRRDHEVRIRLADDPDRLAADMALFFGLHEARWAGEGGGTTLASGTARAYHADFAAAALQRGWLRLWFLELGGRAVAAWYGWRVGPRYCFFNAGWDPRWARASVGLVLLAHTVRSAIEEGATEYDFLLGDEGYKSRFATARRPVETVVLAPTWSTDHVLTRLDRRIRRTADALPSGLRGRLRSAAAPVVGLLPGARSR